MNKQEFVDGLRAALSGRITPAQVEDHVRYYQDYINVEMRKGKTEEDVLGTLGDPRLIARTIIQTSGAGGQEYEEVAYDADRGTAREKEDRAYQSIRRILRLPGWLLALLVILVIILVLSLVFSILSFLAPVILVLAAVIFMVKFFRDWFH